MIEVCLALALFGAGWYLGRRTAKAKKAHAGEAPEQEQLAQDRAAFARLMGYNASQAYGLWEE